LLGGMSHHVNIVGPQVRRLRSGKGWSQNDLSIKLQLLGMEHATRCKVSKIEARLVWVSDDDLIFLSRALGVGIEALYPDFIRDAKRLYEAIATSKASRFGSLIVGAFAGSLMASLGGVLSSSLLGAGMHHYLS